MTKRKAKRASKKPRLSLKTADILSKLQAGGEELEEEDMKVEEEEDEDVYEQYKFMVEGNEDEEDDVETVGAYEEYNEDLY